MYPASTIIERPKTFASQLELSVSAKKLVNKDVTSKSDPQCIVYLKNGFNGQFYEIGRTEVIKDNLNPDWIKKFTIDYRFNESQIVKFEIWDVDTQSKNDFLGEVQTELAAILASHGQFRKKLTSGRRLVTRTGGEILVHAEEVSAVKQSALIQFSASNLDKKDFLGKSDPYLKIYKTNSDGTRTLVHKTEVIRNTLNPKWRPFNISVQQLCSGDYDKNLTIECYDYDDNSQHDLIGLFTTNLRRMTGSVGGNVYDCVNPEKQKRKKGYKNSGIVRIESISISKDDSFLDYIRGGTQMHFAVAIDFTASNGPVQDPRSLHYLDQTGRPNSYEIALRSVGEIIKSYDTQGMFPSFGFGAKIPPHGQVSHQFPLNNNPTHPYCNGVEDILSSYKNMLRSVTLHGPTNFAVVINSTADIARNFQNGKHYFVLLIITDGVISDMPETIDAIVNASSLPLSIIIVGVGNADFSAMNFLDGDGNTIVSRGKRAVRDIVQFVPFNKFSYGDWMQNQNELAKEVLAEIPTQFMQFMQSRGFKPSPVASGGGFPEPTNEVPNQYVPSNPPLGQIYPKPPAPQPPQPSGLPPTAFPASSAPTFPQPSAPAPQLGFPSTVSQPNYPGQPYPSQQNPSQQYPSQQNSSQPYPSQPYPGHPYPGQPGYQAPGQATGPSANPYQSNSSYQPYPQSSQYPAYPQYPPR